MTVTGKFIGKMALASGLAGLLIIGGCSPKRPTSPAPTPVPVPVPGQVALAPADYVREASSISLFAVRASQLIASRNAGLTGFARTIEQEQGGIAAQLSFAGRRVNLLPSAELQPAHAALLAELEASSDPAATYRRQMRLVLEQGAAIHGAFAARGASPTLRPVAEMAAPVFRGELAALKRA